MLYKQSRVQLIWIRCLKHSKVFTGQFHKIFLQILLRSLTRNLPHCNRQNSDRCSFIQSGGENVPRKESAMRNWSSYVTEVTNRFHRTSQNNSWYICTGWECRRNWHRSCTETSRRTWPLSVKRLNANSEQLLNYKTNVKRRVHWRIIARDLI